MNTKRDKKYGKKQFLTINSTASYTIREIQFNVYVF